MNTNFKEWLEPVFRMQGRVSYENVVDILLNKMNFRKSFKIINIVGTNGKGSVTQYINDALIDKGYKVGKFTSPHIFKYNERITINNQEISDEEFFNYVDPMLDTFREKEIMWFGITMIAALKYFQDNEVDYVVMEAGVGGRLDPTGFFDGDYGVVTSIGVDHLDYFDTVENIPYEKAGIMNKDMKFFMGSTLTNKEKDVFIKVAAQKGATVTEVNNEGDDYQIRNQKLANAVFKEITGEEIKTYQAPFGRTTIQNINGHTIIFDVGHNEHGIRASLDYLNKKNIKFDQVLISLSKDKDDSNLQGLFNVPIYLYEHHGFNKQKLISDYKIQGEQIKDIFAFLNNVDKDTLFIGSFYLLGELFDENGNLKSGNRNNVNLR